MYSFPNLEPVHCSMSSSNCCFLTCMQISQEAGQVVWYSYLLKNFPQFIVIHTVKGFGIVNEAEVYVFMKFTRFSYDPPDADNLISGSSAFSKSSLYIWKFSVHVLLKVVQSCLTLCDTTDSSPPGSPVPGIFKARTLEWVAIAFSILNVSLGY